MFTAQEISEATGFPAYEHLKEWCEANAEGRLLILPCGVGDMAWFIAVGKVMYGRCRSISIHAGGIQINMDDTDGEPWSVSVKKVFPHARRPRPRRGRGRAERRC